MHNERLDQPYENEITRLQAAIDQYQRLSFWSRLRRSPEYRDARRYLEKQYSAATEWHNIFRGFARSDLKKRHTDLIFAAGVLLRLHGKKERFPQWRD